MSSANTPEQSGNLTVDELRAEANAISRKWWGVDYTGVITVVKRGWKRRGACCIIYRDGSKPFEIRFSSVNNAKWSREIVIGNLTHELVHWRLYTLGQPFYDDDSEFVAECDRVGAPLSRTKAAKDAEKRYVAIKAYEERTGRKYYEEAAN
jgi:SprT-like protein